MNTKVKVGIAAAIVAALVALIVLDQKTTPKDDTAGKSSAPDAITIVGNGAEPPSMRVKQEEIDSILKEAERKFGEKPSKSANTGGIKKEGEEKNERTIKSLPNEEYVIKEGDTFETIALAKFGSKSYATAIAQANPTVKATALRVNKTIVLPAKGGEKKEESNVAMKDPAPSTDPVPPPVKKSADASSAITKVGDQTFYTVQQGDTLSGISTKVYNTSRYYAKIYEANKDTIEDPSVLYVGAKLLMPNLPAKANTGAPGTGAVATTVPAPAVVSAGAKTVQVAEGGSLWKIAEKFAIEKKIGIHDMMKLIVAANPDKLKDESTMLRLGWSLIIPE